MIQVGQIMRGDLCPDIPGMIIWFLVAVPGCAMAVERKPSWYPKNLPIRSLDIHTLKRIRGWSRYDFKILWIPQDSTDLLYDLTPVYPGEDRYLTINR